MKTHSYRHDEGITDNCFELTKKANSYILLLTLSDIIPNCLQTLMSWIFSL